MSLYAPRQYGSTNKKIEDLSNDAQQHLARYSNLSKRQYIPNNEDIFSDENSFKKKKIIIALLVALGMTQTLYLNISTFLPQFRSQYHPSINDGEVGIILSMFQFAYLIGSPIIGANLQRVGRKNFIVIGYVFIICATFGFGLLTYISNDTAFMVVGILLRFTQGFGDACVSTAGYSIITIEFPTKRESYIGYVQASVGLGLMLGPVIGQALYTLVKYEKTFYIFAGILSLSMIAVILIIPQKTNFADDILSKTEIDQYFERLKSTDGGTSTMYKNIRRSDMNTQRKKISYWMFLKNRRAMMAAISSMLAMIFMLFFDSTLACELKEEMGVGEDYVGYFFGLICLTYAISSPLVGQIIKCVPRRYITCASFLLATLALFMFGPSQLLNFPDTLVLQSCGLALLGCACSVIFVPLLSEIIEGVQEKEGITEVGELNDKAAAIFNTLYAVGCIIAPILGGYLKMATNFRVTCDIMALCSATYGIIYMIVVVIPGCCNKDKNDIEITIADSPNTINNRPTLPTQKSKQSEHKKVNPFATNTLIENVNKEGQEKVQNINHTSSGITSTDGQNNTMTLNLANKSESLLFSASSNLDLTANFDENVPNLNKKQ